LSRDPRYAARSSLGRFGGTFRHEAGRPFPPIAGSTDEFSEGPPSSPAGCDGSLEGHGRDARGGAKWIVTIRGHFVLDDPAAAP
jgi:hypothetical protein